jgi:hypothetical protein
MPTWMRVAFAGNSWRAVAARAGARVGFLEVFIVTKSNHQFNVNRRTRYERLAIQTTCGKCVEALRLLYKLCLCYETFSLDGNTLSCIIELRFIVEAILEPRSVHVSPHQPPTSRSFSI